MNHLIFLSIVALVAGQLVVEHVQAADSGERFSRNVQEAGAALSCGEGRLAGQLKTVTMQYYALHPEVLDLSKIGQGFDDRVALIRKAMGRNIQRKLCEETFLPSARLELSRTQALIPLGSIVR